MRYVTGNDGDMSGIASSLLSSTALPIATRYSSMVRSLSHSADSRWQLHDKAGTVLGSADYLVVAGSGVAHPRWTDTFGGDPPLLAAAAAMDPRDPVLDEALASVAR